MQIFSRATLACSVSKGEDIFCAETGSATLLLVRIVEVAVINDTIVRTIVNVVLVIKVVTTIQYSHHHYY